MDAAPDWSCPYVALGDVARTNRQWAESRAYYERALALEPNQQDALHSLGLFYREQNQLEESVRWFKKAVERNPAAEWISNLGTTLQEMARLPEALEYLERSLAMEPKHPGLHFNRSLVLLLLGRLAEGWEEYAYRLQCPQFISLQRKFSQSVWQGQELKGRRILLHAEQGFGDAIHFVRYAPLVAKLGGKVIVECQPAR